MPIDTVYDLLEIFPFFLREAIQSHASLKEAVWYAKKLQENGYLDCTAEELETEGTKPLEALASLIERLTAVNAKHFCGVCNHPWDQHIEVSANEFDCHDTAPNSLFRCHCRKRPPVENIL
jgi:hypothetical protein